MNQPKKRPSARRGRNDAPAPKPPLVITYKQYKQIESEFKANLLAETRKASAEVDDQDEDDEADAGFRWYTAEPRRGSVLERVLDHVQQKSVDFLRVGDKRGEELMDELHNELERLR
jgi:hypothetical protein